MDDQGQSPDNQPPTDKVAPPPSSSPPPLPPQAPRFDPLSGSDAPLIKEIKQHTTKGGKIAFVLMALGVVALGFLYWQQQAALEDAKAAYYNAHQAATKEEFLDRARQLLAKTNNDELEVEIIGKLGRYKDAKAVPLLIEKLDEVGIVRRAAALALAAIGTPVADAAKPQLLHALANTDARDRTQVVWALAVLKESQAASAIIKSFSEGSLQSQPDFDAKVVTDAVGIAALSAPSLTNHKEEGVRLLVAQSLAESNDPSVGTTLERMLDEEVKREDKNRSTEVVRTVIAGIGRVGNETSSQHLLSLLEIHPELRHSSLSAIARSTSAPGLIKLLGIAKNTSIRDELVRMLRNTHDSRSADALFAQLASDSEPSRVQAALGLAELGDQRSLEILLTVAGGEDDSLAVEALSKIEQLGPAQTYDGLKALLEPYPERRAAILHAMGASGQSQAGKLLEKELKGDDVEAATLALGDLQYGPAYSKLLKQAARPKGVDFSRPSRANEQPYRDRHVALRALARYQRDAAAAVMQQIIEDPEDDARLRALAGSLLMSVAGPAATARAAQMIASADADESTRAAYAVAFWSHDPADRLAQLVNLMGNKDLPWEIKQAVAIGVGHADSAAQEKRLVELLASEDESTRHAAAYALILGASESTNQQLLATLLEDRALAEILQDSFTREDVEWFHIVTESMLETTVWARLRTALALRVGKGDRQFSFAWSRLIGRLKAGWQGPGGAEPRAIRKALYAALTGQDAERRSLAAEALNAMGERGLLLAARDSNQAGAQEARQVMRQAAD